MRLPEFKTNAGNKIVVDSLFEGGERFYVQNSTERETREYARTLTQCGYALISEEEFPTGNGYKDTKNLSYSFVSERECVFLFYDASILTVFVNLTKRTEIPKNLKADSTPFSGELSFSQLKLVGGGMSYALRLSDGRFILVDGGLRCREDAEYLYAFLCDNKGEREIPEIALWIFTHAHADHLELPTYFIKNYGGRVKIEGFAHHFADTSTIPHVHDAEEEREMTEALFSAIEENVLKTTVYTLHTGWRLFYPGLEIEILSTPDNTFTPLYFSLNDMSVIMRFKFSCGSVLLLADSTTHVSRQLAATYGEYLKSDVLQVAHHGLLGGDLNLYKLIDPDICLWPVKPLRFEGNLAGQEYQWCVGEGGLVFNEWLRDDGIKKRAHYHHGVTTTLKF